MLFFFWKENRKSFCRSAEECCNRTATRAGRWCSDTACDVIVKARDCHERYVSMRTEINKLPRPVL